MPVDMFKTKNLKELNKKLNHIGQELIQEASKNIKTDVGEIIFDGANETRNNILKSIQQTPRRMDVFYSRQKGKKRHYPSRPGSPPAIDTGNMIKGILFDAYDYKFIIGSIQTNPPYPEWLEEPPPKAKYDERPWLAPAIDKQEPILVKNLEKVIPDIINKIFREVK